MTFPTAYHADSDADDEYERSLLTSPTLHTDDDGSPADSDPPSTEHTPTTFGHGDADRLSPRTIIAEWTTDDCADYITSLGLSQYCEKFLENEIVGEALIALKHDELKEMGIISVGHRLTILKGVYDVKMKHEVPIDLDHYIPLSADAHINDKAATQEDISRIIHSLKLRDERLKEYEVELRKVTEEYRKLREEVLPIVRMAKDRSQPLPYQPSASSPDFHNSHEGMASPVPSQAPNDRFPTRKQSTKKFTLGLTPKSSSPTHLPHSIPEGKSMSDNSNLDPSAAALAASNHLTASISGGQQNSTSPNQVNIPSPTSPNTYHNQPTLASRSYANTREPPAAARMYPRNDEDPHTTYSSTASTLNGDRDRSNPTPTPGASSRVRQHPPEDSPSSNGGRDTSSSAPSVEIFKSFRVSMDDPCYKVLPAALKRYNINADWRQYALYIVYGDQERCLGLEEKPLILFKALDKEGRKPMFMLRRHAAPVEGHSGPSGVGGMQSGAFDSSSISLGSARGHQSSIHIGQLPGGVL
ncbi:Adaptor for signal transduction [Loxospora ochrophaea]|nr:Adaptor for signal transduction [Loxospora ochrophaea]